VVGTHPIAGSHASGASAARADLFRDRLCVLTPTPATDRGALARIRALWQGVGARTEDMSPRQHDAILARISHVPHLVAYALVAAAADSVIDGRPVLDYAGSGFLDTTRIAGSRAEIWRDIVRANAGAIRAALGEFRAALDRLEELARSSDGNDLEKALASAAAHRQRLGGPR
jgi:prephenate dehydrogenase